MSKKTRNIIVFSAAYLACFSVYLPICTSMDLSARSEHLLIFVSIMILLIDALSIARFIDFNMFNFTRCVLVTLSVVSLMVFFSSSFVDDICTEVIVHEFKNECNIKTVASGERAEFSFSNYRCPFNCIELRFNEANSFSAVIEIDNENTDQMMLCYALSEGSINSDSESDRNTAVINTASLLPKGDYRVIIQNMGTVDIPVETNDENGEVINARIVQHTKLGYKVFLFCVFILLFYLSAMYISIKKGSISPEKFFLLSSAALVIIYFILIAPWNVPDSFAHYSASYRFSNIILGYGKEKEWSGRIEDVSFYINQWGYSTNPSMLSYTNLSGDFSLFAVDGSTMIDEVPFKQENMEFYSFLNYIPQTIGMVLGRVMNFSPVAVTYLARFITAITYVALCLHSIKSAPVGKYLVAFFTLTPMPLMMSSGFSYDMMVIVVSLNYFTSILAARNNNLTKKSVAKVCFWTFMLGGVKGGGYLILLPLLFLMFNIEEKRKSLESILLAFLCGFCSLILFDIVFRQGSELYQIGSDNEEKLSALFAFSNPINYFQMILMSYYKYSSELIMNMLGSQLGWLERTIPDFIICLYLFSMLAASSSDKQLCNLQKRDINIIII